MSVYIKGMEMPHNCVGCKLWYLIPLADTMEDICRVTGHRVNPYHRADDCPLVPVPDHGRLIDADALKKRAERGTEEHGRPCMLIKLGYVNTMPTIIPADADKEDEA